MEASLERLADIRRNPDAPGAVEGLRSIIAGKHSHAVATAADIVAEAHIESLQPELVAAFDRLMQQPVKLDPGCRAKAAIAQTLQQLDAYEDELYLQGVRHVQMEPVYKGQQDTATALRGACARGLVHTNHPDALTILAELLADPESPARLAAARAIAYQGSSFALPLLRLKILSGDAEIEVITECMVAMLRISADSSVEFVARFLWAGDAPTAEAAALALGESRAPEALPVLQRWWREVDDPDLARMGLLSIALLHSDEAIEYLLSLIREQAGPIVREAIAAFEIYRHDDTMVERVRATALKREELDLHNTLEKVLG